MVNENGESWEQAVIKHTRSKRHSQNAVLGDLRIMPGILTERLRNDEKLKSF